MVIWEQTYELEYVGGRRKNPYIVIQSLPLNGFKFRGGIYRRIYFG
jgi:hypothetical protein